MSGETPMIPVNAKQMIDVFQYMDGTQPEAVKKELFSRLGRACFSARKVGDWVASFGGDVQAFLDHINTGKKSPYWEELRFNNDNSVLHLTGRPVSKCACFLGACERPPASLCTYCCKTFQELVFSALFQRSVDVRIVESFILGGSRCSTAIHLSRPYSRSTETG